jgi:hypothetical protein
MNELTRTAEKNVVRFGEYSVARASALQDTIAFAGEHPEYVKQTFAQYHIITRDLFALTDKELELIQQVNMKLGKSRGADEFITHMRPYREEILEIAKHAGDLENIKNQQGVTQLATMMDTAWNINKYQPGWKPTDGDPRSDNVIWGFVNGATDPRINIHFIICHGIERIETQHFKDKGIDYTHHKDWLVVPMTDPIIYWGLQGKYPEKNVLPFWERPRPDGLNWASEQRKNAFKAIILRKLEPTI